MKRVIFYVWQVTFGMLLLTSCSDEWNDHYDVTSVENGTLWQAISGKEDLSNFARVVEACGYDKVLDGSQTYSVFAPTNAAFPAEEADSLINAFNLQAAQGTRSNDNTVVRQFLQNHIALYRHPVSSLTADSITMMNSKYAFLTASTLGDRNLLTKNTLYNNGLLFTLDKKLDYFPNVYEYLGHDRDLDSVYNFLSRYSNYQFNEALSVPGEIVDGQTVYLDSVSELNNSLLSTLGLINSEDSTYWLLCPTNGEWNRLVAEYEPYFDYPLTVAKRDSLIYANTRMAIMGGAFFSRTANPDEAFQDSAVSTRGTMYNLLKKYGMEENSYYTYSRPFDKNGIFDGTEDIVCSNGHVLKANQFKVSKFQTFLQTVKVEAEDILYQDTIINAVDPLVIREVLSNNPYYGKVSGNTFVEVQPDPATAQVTVRYRIPSLLSNVDYDIYAVFVPATAYDTLAVEETTKPNIVLPDLYWPDRNGRETGTRSTPRNDRRTVNTAVVDTVLLMEKMSIPITSYGLDAVTKLRIMSNLSSSQTATHSSTLRIDCIIFRPHELDEADKDN